MSAGMTFNGIHEFKTILRGYRLGNIQIFLTHLNESGS